MKRVILSVTNDLSTDQRVHKMCMTLMDMGFDVNLVGRKLPGSLPLDRPYRTFRMKLWFRKGGFFYAEYNLRLFFFLLSRKAELLVANDLDTLTANYLAARIKGTDLVYDTHEYFCGVPEIQNRPLVKAIWRSIERAIFPRLKHIITVNKSIASLYRAEYGKELLVVRNVPYGLNAPPLSDRKSLGLPEDKFILIVQGSGINVDRGVEEMFRAVAMLQDVLLLVVGSGDVMPVLREMAGDEALKDKLHFEDKMPYDRLMQYTASADAGLSLDKDSNINYRYSLPNKVFDYIQCRIPLLVSDLPEVAGIVREYGLGEVIPDHRPESIAKQVNVMRAVGKGAYAENLERAARELTWERECGAVISLYRNFLNGPKRG